MPLMLKVIDKIHLTCVLYILFVFFKTCEFQCDRRKIFGTWVAIFVMVVGFHKRRKLFRLCFCWFLLLWTSWVLFCSVEDKFACDYKLNFFSYTTKKKHFLQHWFYVGCSKINLKRTQWHFLKINAIGLWRFCKNVLENYHSKTVFTNPS